jgi:hypothetical protein
MRRIALSLLLLTGLSGCMSQASFTKEYVGGCERRAAELRVTYAKDPAAIARLDAFDCRATSAAAYNVDDFGARVGAGAANVLVMAAGMTLAAGAGPYRPHHHRPSCTAIATRSVAIASCR